jgi:uncharacterized membrane protein YhhN
MKNNINKANSLGFFLLASIFVVSTLVKPYPLSWAVKLLPMLLLIILAIKKLGFSKSGKFFIFGLLFSACGDFILDYDRQHWFIFGLGAFFIAHLFYLASLKPFVKSLKQPQYLLIALLYIGYGGGMLSLLAEGLGELFVPVVAYMSILLLMALATVLSEKSNAWLIVGGISFVFSDSLIGFDKFYLPITHVSFAIMVSYYFAQFALLKGFIKAYDHST